MDPMGAHDQPSKYLQVGNPDYLPETSPRSDNNTSLSSKMKRILASPKVSRGKAAPNPNKTFGVPLESLTDRDKADIPLIVSRICEYLRSQGFRQEGLFRVNGNMKVVDRLKTAFDKCGDANLEEIGDVPAAASLLKMFLRELTDPVIPESLQPIFIKVQDQHCKEKEKAIPLIKELIKRMPRDNAYLLKYLCEFMLAIADGSDVNKMTPLALAIVFGPNIFRCGEGLEGLRDQAYVNAVLLLILQEYEEMFMVENEQFPASKSRVAPEKPDACYDTKNMKMVNNSNTKPARPPPPILDTNDDADQERNSSSSPEKSPRRNSSKSPRRNGRRKNSKSPRQDSTNNQRNVSKKKNKKEPQRSSSPSFDQFSSPLCKQLVVSTISSAVKEHLFGPDMLISSTESENTFENKHAEEQQSLDSLQSVDDDEYIGTELGSVYPSVKERVKKFSIGSEPSGSPSKKSKANQSNKLPRPALARSFSSPTNMKSIGDDDLDFIQSSNNRSHPLEHLTAARAQPPRNRRKPASYVRNSDNDIHSKSSSSSSSKTSGTLNEDGYDYQTIYSERLVPPTHENTRNKNNKHDGKTRRTTGDVGVNSFQRMNILQLQEEEIRGSETTNTSGSSYLTNGKIGGESNSSLPSPNEIYLQIPGQKRQDSVPLTKMSPHELKKRIIQMKKSINTYEDEFQERHGRKPKASEKVPIRTYMEELGRAKKQYKELVNDHKENPDPTLQTAASGRDLGNVPNLREIINREAEPTKEQTLSSLLKRLEEKRTAAGRPHEILAMSSEELKEEKLAVQKSLLQYENLHDRPSSKEDKALMRPIYDRYRRIKRLIAAITPEDTANEHETIYDASIIGRTHDEGYRAPRDEAVRRTPRELIHSPTTEYYTIVTVDDENSPGTGEDGSSTLLGDTFSVTNRLPYTPEPFSPPPLESGNVGFEDSVLHEASLSELLEQLKETKNTKRRLGKVLKNFEDDFSLSYNRKVQKDDRLPREAEYREYKLIKAKLRLVEALIAKKKNSIESARDTSPGMF